jgi:signal transduction histidine kinase
MLGPLEQMKRASAEAPVPPPQDQQVDLIHRNGLRLLKLVTTLLDFSRIEAGRVQATYEPTDSLSSPRILRANSALRLRRRPYR